ncbi:hypothetical protein [Croceimicrobium sp.]|uniref:hypothetical protein n=1 Tax=Croceimicrobium sp. TaxID=2828340 RepID=UPI003BA9C734
MSKQTPNPAAFQKNSIVYEDEYFAVAYGMDSKGNKRMAMRWKGDGNTNMGYPKTFGNPQWFLLPEYDTWTPEILKAVERIAATKMRLDDLESKW